MAASGGTMIAMVVAVIFLGLMIYFVVLYARAKQEVNAVQSKLDECTKAKNQLQKDKDECDKQKATAEAANKTCQDKLQSNGGNGNKNGNGKTTVHATRPLETLGKVLNPFS